MHRRSHRNKLTPGRLCTSLNLAYKHLDAIRKLAGQNIGLLPATRIKRAVAG